MNLVELWEILTPKKENIDIIKKDLSVGIAGSAEISGW